MKFYSFYTSSHRQMKDEWFLASIKDDFEFVLLEQPQQCLSANYMQEGWIDCMKKKIDLILRAIKENEGKVFIHSDVDIQFFKPIKKIIENEIKNKDLLIQKNSRIGKVCPGFLAAVGNEKNLRLWLDVRNELEQRAICDQKILNDLLIENSPFYSKKLANLLKSSYQTWLPNDYGIKWSYLPDTFYCPGINRPKRWKVGDHLHIPKEIALHHANWTIGVENKVAQLEYVKDLVDRKTTA